MIIPNYFFCCHNYFHFMMRLKLLNARVSKAILYCHISFRINCCYIPPPQLHNKVKSNENKDNLNMLYYKRSFKLHFFQSLIKHTISFDVLLLIIEVLVTTFIYGKQYLASYHILQLHSFIKIFNNMVA